MTDTPSVDRGVSDDSELTPGQPGDSALDGIEVVHVRLRDGRCVVSLNGQGHLPCTAHPPEPPGGEPRGDV